MDTSLSGLFARLRERGIVVYLLAHMLVWSLVWGPATTLLNAAIGGQPLRLGSFVLFMLMGLGAGLTFGLWMWFRTRRDERAS